ncbi:pyridoxal phosphate-dependent aminotransferase [Kribbella solani]|uniref:pyridoxal phosphate-dependent aminotransferase n=2 Tax=Kribbella solani TaxID=236067 RepID=UPI0029B73DB7|nr:pyridoxal phosphate-dependent aminotransferase [Kribbella solani]MDX3001770.1 pyridoxal phosphate-dependent aminotransferase [Kribbella solani]
MVTTDTNLEEQRRIVRQARTELLQLHRRRAATPSGAGGAGSAGATGGAGAAVGSGAGGGAGVVGRAAGGGVEPPIRVMARVVQELRRECAARRFDPVAARLEIVDRTIGDVNLRLVTECEGPEGGPGDYRMLADELGIALPGENLNGYVATGGVHHWLREQMTAAERELLATGYDPRVYDIHGIGNPILRGRLADDLRPWGFTLSAANIALGLGATDCIDKVLRGLAHRGSPGAVLFATPGFNMPELQATAYGYRLHPVRTVADNNFKLTAQVLQQELSANPDITVVYLTITNNPTTFAYTPDELSELQSVLTDAQVYLLADLAYVGTGQPDDDHERMRRLSVDADLAPYLICVGSFSKTHTLTGERFGWVAFGDTAFATAMGASWTNSVGSLPGDWQLRYMAYQTLFRRDPGLIPKIRALYRLRRTRLREQLRQYDAEHRLFDHIYLDDDATIYNWSRLRPGADCFEVLEKTGIAGIPGSTFGYSDDYIRFSVGISPISFDGSHPRTHCEAGHEMH